MVVCTNISDSRQPCELSGYQTDFRCWWNYQNLCSRKLNSKLGVRITDYSVNFTATGGHKGRVRMLHIPTVRLYEDFTQARVTLAFN